MAAVLKTAVGKPTVGSNPTLSATFEPGNAGFRLLNALRMLAVWMGNARGLRLEFAAPRAADLLSPRHCALCDGCAVGRDRAHEPVIAA